MADDPKFLPWATDPTDRPTGPMRIFVDQTSGDETLQTWVFRQYNEVETERFNRDRNRGDQRRGETQWFDVPKE